MAPSAYCLAPRPMPAMAVSAAAVHAQRLGAQCPGRLREGLPPVALVVRLEGLCGVDVGVGHRLIAQRLGRLREVVEVEVGGHVDRGIALGQLQSDGLPLLDVAQHLAIVGAHSEAELVVSLPCFP